MSAKSIGRFFAVASLAMASAVGVGMGPRLRQREALARTQAELAKPRRVRVAVARAGEATSDLLLPGASSPLRASTLYAKTTGFVRQNLVDVGEHVTAGQVLARIDAPETGEEIRLARAKLDEAEANVGIVRTTSERADKLREAGVFSQQSADEARAQANSAVASVSTRRAEVARLEVLRGYQQIVAPFDGVITRRGTDPGALVGPSAAGGTVLFDVADVEKLRVLVDVPDAYAADVKLGLAARVFSPRTPAETIEGSVVRTSGVLDRATRTLRVELRVPGKGAVMPGAFVYVRFAIPREHPAPVVPASALLVRKEGLLVARTEGGRLRLVPVKLGRDFGKELEILDGIEPGAQIVVNASDDLEDGQPVEALLPGA